MKTKFGFTLIELMIVVIIVGILTAVALPLMRANSDRAKESEAVTVCAVIRKAVIDMEMKTGSASGAKTVGDLNGFISASDANGTYYRINNYSLDITDLDNFEITVGEGIDGAPAFTYIVSAGSVSIIHP